MNLLLKCSHKAFTGIAKFRTKFFDLIYDLAQMKAEFDLRDYNPLLKWDIDSSDECAKPIPVN